MTNGAHSEYVVAWALKGGENLSAKWASAASLRHMPTVPINVPFFSYTCEHNQLDILMNSKPHDKQNLTPPGLAAGKAIIERHGGPNSRTL